jgi:hypothetical protein
MRVLLFMPLYISRETGKRTRRDTHSARTRTSATRTRTTWSLRARTRTAASGRAPIPRRWRRTSRGYEPGRLLATGRQRTDGPAQARPSHARTAIGVLSRELHVSAAMYRSRVFRGDGDLPIAGARRRLRFRLRLAGPGLPRFPALSLFVSCLSESLAPRRAVRLSPSCRDTFHGDGARQSELARMS